jgi:hypothetical protein
MIMTKCSSTVMERSGARRKQLKQNNNSCKKAARDTAVHAVVHHAVVYSYVLIQPG